MTIHMDDSGIKDIAGIKRFLKGSRGIKLSGVSREEKCRWITAALRRFAYFKQRKKDKNAVKSYMLRMTGFPDAQMTRLIGDQRQDGRIGLRTGSRHCFARACSASLRIATIHSASYRFRAIPAPYSCSRLTICLD